jgi:hypothetical protein
VPALVPSYLIELARRSNGCWWTIPALVHRPSVAYDGINIGIIRRHPAQKEPNYPLIISVGIGKRGATMTQVFCESYVHAILDQAAGHQSMSRDDFYRLFRGHITAGFRAEVDEASLRYFKRKRTLVPAKFAA